MLVKKTNADLKMLNDNCPMDVLFARNLPHILTDIFLMLNPQDFERCSLVSKTWYNFIKNYIMSSEVYRDRIEAKKLLYLWKNETFSEWPLLPKSLVWKELDVEGVSCSGSDIILASNEKILLFRNLRLKCQHQLLDSDRVKQFFVGNNIIFVVLNGGNSIAVFDRDTLREIKRSRLEEAFEHDSVQKVDGVVYILRTRKDFIQIKYVEEETGEEIVYRTFQAKKFLREGMANRNMRQCAYLLSERFLLLAHEDGCLDLVDHVDNVISIRERYSKDEENFINKPILTETFCGVIYKSIGCTSDKGLNFVIFDNECGNVLARREKIESYGRTYFSATKKFFVFSYADALHNQHFLVFRVHGRKKQWNEFILVDR